MTSCQLLFWNLPDSSATVGPVFAHVQSPFSPTIKAVFVLKMANPFFNVKKVSNVNKIIFKHTKTCFFSTTFIDLIYSRKPELLKLYPNFSICVFQILTTLRAQNKRFLNRCKVPWLCPRAPQLVVAELSGQILEACDALSWLPYMYVLHVVRSLTIKTKRN